MRVEILDSGEPEVCVVGSLHGNEPCGKKAIEKFVESDFEILKPIKLIVANQKALDKGERYLDKDLNRVFPGDKKSDSHEERLAADIMDEVRGTTVLDLHSSHSTDEPFAVMDGMAEKEEVSLVEKMGVQNAVYFPDEEGTLAAEVTGLNVEAGKQKTDQAAENAYQVLLNFLAANGVIGKKVEGSKPRFFQSLGIVDGGDWEFKAENFEKVEEGEVYAEKSDKKLRADRDFYPVLMSTDGYDSMLGWRAEKISKPKVLKDCSS